jgi:prepilin-type N-terminal cleavage/methylation domain-containing protein
MSRQGFSMIEILAVLTIVAILATLAFPRISQWGTRNKASRALNLVATDVSFTRMRAIRGGNSATIRFSNTGYTISVLGTGTAVNVLKTVDLTAEYPNIRITTSPATAQSLVYDSRGLFRSGPTHVVVQTGGVRDSITITALGKVDRAR